MRKFILVAGLSAFLSSCGTTALISELPPTFTAVPKQSEFTGWALDHCRNTTPARLSELEESPDCLSFGGEIYKVRLMGIESTTGAHLGGAYLLVPRHALHLSRWNREIWHFTVKEATEELQNATGIKYIATKYESGVKRE